jgi:phosphate/sulfate permease
MESQLWIVIGLVAVALAFDYINRFHDAANSIPTVVSTRMLSARQGWVLTIPGSALIGATVFWLLPGGAGA